MGYRIDNKDVDLSGLRQLTFVPSEKAGDVYRFRNSALRVFREGETPIDKETASYFTDVSTERILLPRKLLFYNNAFKGYTMKLVSQKGAGKKIITTPTRDFVECVEALEKDIEVISQKKILLNGITPGYSLYNGELYLVNPANYSVLELERSEKLEQLNEFQLHLLVTELVAAELRRMKYPQSCISNVKDLFGLRDVDQTSSSFLKEIIDGQENIKELVKRIG
ncbi:MAG: hypothetical protein IKF71_04775 [Bacilli bacterium]|nr:hypothetical protein [Bacilli bacterium]